MRLRIAFHRGTTFQSGDDAHALRKLSRYGNGVPRWSRPAVLRRVCFARSATKADTARKSLIVFRMEPSEGFVFALAERTAGTATKNESGYRNIVKKRKNVLTHSWHFG